MSERRRRERGNRLGRTWLSRVVSGCAGSSSPRCADLTSRKGCADLTSRKGCADLTSRQGGNERGRVARSLPDEASTAERERSDRARSAARPGGSSDPGAFKRYYWWLCCLASDPGAFKRYCWCLCRPGTTRGLSGRCWWRLCHPGTTRELSRRSSRLQLYPVTRILTDRRSAWPASGRGGVRCRPSPRP